MRYRGHGKDLYLGGSQGAAPFHCLIYLRKYTYNFMTLQSVLWETLPMKIWVKYILPQDNRASHFCYHGKSTLVSLFPILYIYIVYILQIYIHILLTIQSVFLHCWCSASWSCSTLYIPKSHICFRPVNNYLPNFMMLFLCFYELIS